MATILETDRLRLREFELNDAEDMWKLNEDEEVIRYTGDPPFESVDSAREFLENYPDYRHNGYGRWAVLKKGSGEFIGWCGLKLNEEGYIDIGFRFFKKEWGKGYATEAAQACLDYGFNKLGMKEIIGRAARKNIASLKVLEKLGMEFWKEDGCKGIEDSLYYKVRR